MSACTCNHVESDHGRYTHTAMCHCAFIPAATERTTTMTDNPTPADLARFVYPVPVGATIPGGTEWVNRETPATFTGPHVRRNDFQTGPNTPRWTAEPIEPPKPALPTEPGTVIRCAINGDAGATLIRGRTYWHGIAPGGFAVQNVNSPASPNRITDWTVVYDPTAPKADDGLRERVEALAKAYRSTADGKPSDPALDNEYRQGFRAASLFHSNNIRRILTETSADA